MMVKKYNRVITWAKYIYISLTRKTFVENGIIMFYLGFIQKIGFLKKLLNNPYVYNMNIFLLNHVK